MPCLVPMRFSSELEIPWTGCSVCVPMPLRVTCVRSAAFFVVAATDLERSGSGMVSLATLGLMSVLLAGSTPAPADGDDSDAMKPPVIDGMPVEVMVGFYVLDFARITSRDESFELTAYLEMKWRDPRLAWSPGAGAKAGASRHVDPKRVWMPEFFFENAIEQPHYHHDPVATVDQQGMVTSWVIVNGKFSSPMDLRVFPFDRQVLAIRIASFEDDESVEKYVVNPEIAMVGDDAFVTDWNIGKSSARVDSKRYGNSPETYTRYIYEIAVERRSTFYVWRVMLPLTLLAVVSFSVLWFDPTGLQPQISTCMAALIALVAFNFVVDFSLPKVGYLTLVDRHALIGFGFVAAGVVEVTLIHVAVTRNRLTTARAIQRVGRWVYPSGYLLAVLWNLRFLFT